MIVDFDDFGANHVISDQCQSHDCRDKLLELKKINPKFKVTLFAIPCEMTDELASWASANRLWVELAFHGFRHDSNYECEKMNYAEFDGWMKYFNGYGEDGLPRFRLAITDDNIFVRGFKAPGWQISDDIYVWLRNNGWWVADQEYNDARRPKDLPVYKIGEDSWHGHTWDCVGNGIYETFPELSKKVAEAKEFKFVSEVVSA